MQRSVQDVEFLSDWYGLRDVPLDQVRKSFYENDLLEVAHPFKLSNNTIYLEMLQFFRRDIEDSIQIWIPHE